MSDTRRIVGYVITSEWCRECVPDGVEESYDPERESDDGTVVGVCQVCGKPFTPCDHEWEEWKDAFQSPGIQEKKYIRFCKKPHCSEADYADLKKVMNGR